MTLQEALDRYCLARSQRQIPEQLYIANILVDELIPDLYQRLGEVMVERNKAWSAIHHHGGV